MRNLLVLTLFIFSSIATSDAAITVMSYNVENLFDSLDDPGKDDKAYLPYSLKQNKDHIEACNKVRVEKWKNECLYFDWTEAAKNKKLENIKKVILHSNKNGPDIIAFQEVENINVLSELFELLKPYGYIDLALLEGNDYRGIDTGYISKYKIDYKKLHKIKFSPEFKSKDTRPIFEVHIKIGEQLVRLYNIHFPAPYHPVGMRNDSFTTLENLVNKHSDPFIALGDFNVTSRESEEHNTFYKLEENWAISNHEGCIDCKGTHYYWRDKNWSYLDKIMISKNRGLAFNSSSITTVITEINTNDDKIPEGFDTKTGHGVSDHLPIFAEILL